MMLDKKLEEYRTMFKEGFPMIPLKWGRTDEQVIEIINRCIKEGKDVYELGYVIIDDDVMY